MARSNDWFGDIFDEIDRNLGDWGAGIRVGFGPGRKRRRAIFETGDIKFVILRLIRERPRHGYDIIKELEQRFGGCYTPSAGTVYPTLQLLEDEGYVRVVESEGKKTYHITPEGEAFLDEHSDTIEEMFDRVRETVRDMAGGAGQVREVHARMTTLVKMVYRQAWRRGAQDPVTREMLAVLDRATEEVRALQSASS